MIPLPNKKYQIIYADPAWDTKYFKETKEGMLSRRLPYDTMSDKQIINLPVKEIISQDAILFIWCIDSKIPILLKIFRNWGFKYIGVGFVWHKKAKTTKGENATFTSYTRKSCELCFIGAKGKYLVRDPKPQFLSDSKREHSRKPDEIRKRIIQMCGDLPRIELFARQKIQGWDVWGNEVPKDTQNILKTTGVSDTQAKS